MTVMRTTVCRAVLFRQPRRARNPRDSTNISLSHSGPCRPAEYLVGRLVMAQGCSAGGAQIRQELDEEPTYR
jgi:hypothetical protein